MNPHKTYRQDVSLFREAWLDEEGDLHREDGPAYILYHEDGVTIRGEYWYKHGKSHRLDGPAIIHYYEDGNTQHERWYIDDEQLTEEQALAYKRNLVINKLLDQ